VAVLRVDVFQNDFDVVEVRWFDGSAPGERSWSGHDFCKNESGEGGSCLLFLKHICHMYSPLYRIIFFYLGGTFRILETLRLYLCP
jgi:hypothetical protein